MAQDFNPNPNPNQPSRDELVERIAMMESMIAEGRKATAQYGWIFILWGVADLIGMAWQFAQQNNMWIWPVTLGTAFVVQFIGMAILRRQGRDCVVGFECRAISVVWGMMGMTVSLYCAAAIIHKSAWQISYVAAILMFVGMAHAISALILRWKVQGAVAAMWLLGGVGCFYAPGIYLLYLVVAEMFFGLVVFGIYVMLHERGRSGGTPVTQHA